MSSALDLRPERLVASMQFLQLMTRTFSTLELTDRQAISDTLGALVATFLDCRARMVLLLDTDGELQLSTHEGIDDLDGVLSADARAQWQRVMDDKHACTYEAEEIEQCWPGAPAALRHGLACAAIDLHDEGVGVLVAADRRSRQPFDDDELSFLSVAAGLASMALANADAHQQQDEQRRLAEVRAELAAAEARDKQVALAELDRKLKIIEDQRAQISELSTPILRLRAEVVVLPVIGSLDPVRGEAMQMRLMDELSQVGARFVIIDITGVELVDTLTAEFLLRIARCVKLLGVECVLTGIRPAVAQTLVGLGAALDSLIIRATLGDGLDACMGRRDPGG